MSLKRLLALTLLAGLTAFPVRAEYLNIDNITVEIDPDAPKGLSNNTFSGGRTIDKVIDAPSADAEEFHNQATHIWFYFKDPSQGLNLIFDLKRDYDINTLHFWNYTGEGYDVDRITFTFYNKDREELGTRSLEPALGSVPGIRAQDILLNAPLNVRYVRAVLTGTNGHIDFQNIGFTAERSRGLN